MSNEEIEFPTGLFAKAPHPNAPDFVKGKLSVKRADFGNYLRGKEGDWLNFDIKESKDGKWYVALDTWQPEKEAPAPKTDDFDDDVPF